MYTYPYPRPIMAADSVVFTLKDDAVHVVLIERGHEPYMGCLAFPGGFVNENEPLDDAAARELREETGLTGIPMRQWQTFGGPGRDPRGWTVSVVYIAVIDHRAHPLQHGDDAAAAAWYPLANLPPLAFDHDCIVRYALEWLRINVDRNEFTATCWPSSFSELESSAFRTGLDAALEALRQRVRDSMRIEAGDALIVTDIQNDFCPGGALAVAEGDAIIPGVNALLPRFKHVVFTRDWHPADHCSFSDNPAFIDKSWPVHCVQGTTGAAFHPGLEVPPRAWIVSKGSKANTEAYSSFQDSDLAVRLKAKGVARVFVCGIATDYCVKATALDAHAIGLDTVIIENLCKGVDVPAGSVAAALEQMSRAGIAICRSEDLT